MGRSSTSIIRKPQGRSRVTNGKSLLPRGADGRSIWVRRVTDLISLHSSDLGGESNMSEAEKAIVRRSCVIITALEKMELRFATIPDAESVTALETYQRLANTLRRLLESVGIQRRARDVTPPTLRKHLRDKYGVTDEAA